MKNLIYICLIFCMISCASTNSVINLEGVVIKRAAYDFNCPENYIKTVQLGLSEYGASGCGQKAQYKVKCSLGPCVAVPLEK